MLKKLSLLSLCGVSLLGLTGCSPLAFLFMVEEESTTSPDGGISVEINEGSVSVEGDTESWGTEYFIDEGSLGLKPEVLFEALNRLNPELGLENLQFYQHEDDNSYYTASPHEKVIITYSVFDDSMIEEQLKEEASVGLLSGLMVHYDHTDVAATNYAEQFLVALNQIALHGELENEISNIAEGFADFGVSYYTLPDDELEEVLEGVTETFPKELIETSNILEVNGLAMIEIY